MPKPLKIVINYNSDDIYIGDNLWNHPEYGSKPVFEKVKDCHFIAELLEEIFNRLDCPDIIVEVINEDTRKSIYES